MVFYLGTHIINWLFRVPVPMMISRRRLAQRRTLSAAAAPWILDSGGFSELSLYGEWRTTPCQYVDEVRRFKGDIGRLEWAAIQDWMTEPFITGKTGLSIAEHQRRTVQSWQTLNDMDDSLPWAPILQGQTLFDYLEHLEMYARAGVDLVKQRIVGLGSVCRRQGTREIDVIAGHLKSLGLRLHGFGVKTKGLPSLSWALDSSDSLAWSFDARHSPALPGHNHRNCANCLDYALLWREKVVNR